jgi:hypothetical protein
MGASGVAMQIPPVGFMPLRGSIARARDAFA